MHCLHYYTVPVVQRVTYTKAQSCGKLLIMSNIDFFTDIQYTDNVQLLISVTDINRHIYDDDIYHCGIKTLWLIYNIPLDVVGSDKAILLAASNQ